MRSFDSNFAAEIARDDSEPFWTAAFYFKNAFGTILVADRPIDNHIVLADENSWGQLASVFDRRSLRLDVQTLSLNFINYPIKILSSQRFSEILRQRSEATEVDIFMNVRRKSDDAIFTEKLFRGVIQGDSSWSTERVNFSIASLYERYLRGNVLRTVDPEIFKFCHDKDKNATFPLAFGRAPRCIGRVVKGRLISDTHPALTNNPASGTLREVSINWPALRLRYPQFSTDITNGVTIPCYVYFTTTLDYSVSIGDFLIYEGKITEDFISFDGIFQIDSGAWEGVFNPADIFYFTVDTTRSEIVFSDHPSVFGFSGIDTVYCNDVALSQQDINLGATASYEIGSQDSLRGSTIVHYDGYSGGITKKFIIAATEYNGVAPDGTKIAVVVPFVVPEMLADSRLLKVGIPLNRVGNPPPLHLEVFDTFNPYGTGEGGTPWKRSFITYGGEEHNAFPQDDQFIGGDSQGFGATAPSLSARESPISRSGAIFPSEAHETSGTSFSYSGNRVTWFDVDQDLIPGRTYYMVLMCNDGNADDRTQDAADNYWIVGAIDNGDRSIYVAPPSPQRALRLRAKNYFPHCFASNTVYSDGAWTIDPEIQSLNLKMVYAGGVLNSAPGAASWVQPICVNRGMIATKLGVFLKGNPAAKGSVLIELKAAETTGVDREVVGSVMLTSAQIRGIPTTTSDGRPLLGRRVEDWLDRPTLIRPGFYNVHVHVQADENGEVSGITPLGTPSSAGSHLFVGSGGSNFGLVGSLQWPTLGGSKSVTMLANGQTQTISMAITITAAIMTKELNALDDTDTRVARVTFNTWLPDEWVFTADLRALTLFDSANPSRIIQGLLEYAPVPDSAIDIYGSFAATYDALEALLYSFDGQLFEQVNWKELMLRLAFECRSVIDWSIDKARLKFTPFDPGVSVATIDYAGTRARGLVPEIVVKRSGSDILINFIDLLYARDNRVNDRWISKAHAEAPDSIAIYGKQDKPDLFKMKLVRKKAMAQDLAHFYKHRFANPKDAIEAQTFIDNLAIEKDDQVTLTGL